MTINKDNDKIGITGTTGFIGNNVVKYLAEKGYKIRSFGKDPSRKFEHENIEWKFLDLNFSKPEDFKGLTKIVHFAGSHNAQMAFEKNVGMLKEVLESVSENPDLTFYLISTYAVFGDRKTPAEPNDPHFPLDDYSKSKDLAEKEFQEFISNNKNKGVVIRPCTLYGKYGKNFIDIIVEKAKRKEKISMVHFRNQFLHVSDFCKELESIINLENPNPSYNINGEVITEEELEKVFIQLNIDYALNETEARSYWCNGAKLNRDHSVLDYLKSQI